MAIKKLHHHYNHVAVPLLVSFFTSGVVSGISTLRGMGWVDGVVHTWLTSWMLSWPISFSAMFLVLPLMRRFVALFVEERRTHP